MRKFLTLREKVMAQMERLTDKQMSIAFSDWYDLADFLSSPNYRSRFFRFSQSSKDECVGTMILFLASFPEN